MSEQPMPREWLMWAGIDVGQRMTTGEDPDEVVYRDFGADVRTPRFEGHQHPVQVRVTENPDGPYWGWIARHWTGRVDAAPTMIFRRRVLFTMGFPQPPEQLERAGQGEIVRLAVSAVSP